MQTVLHNNWEIVNNETQWLTLKYSSREINPTIIDVNKQ